MGARTRRSLRAALAGSLLIGGLTTVSLAAATALTGGTASASAVTLFSSTIAGTYPVSVPAGVTSVTIAAVGGTGGGVGGLGEPGGEGAVVTATVAVNPGDNLTVTVASNGSTTNDISTAAGGSGAGTGGEGLPEENGPSGDGGGGGSAVFDGTTPLAVAGGGGGGGFVAGGGNAGESVAAPADRPGVRPVPA
jgi:hypothetical protein